MGIWVLAHNSDIFVQFRLKCVYKFKTPLAKHRCGCTAGTSERLGSTLIILVMGPSLLLSRKKVSPKNQGEPHLPPPPLDIVVYNVYPPAPPPPLTHTSVLNIDALSKNLFIVFIVIFIVTSCNICQNERSLLILPGAGVYVPITYFDTSIYRHSETQLAFTINIRGTLSKPQTPLIIL